jgi:DNA-binding PadR family transcriptional regulator
MSAKDKDEASLGRFGQPATLVLIALSDGPKHGYLIMQEIEREMGMSIGPGTLYGAIAKLLRQGLIAGLAEEDRQRPYEITSAGRTALAEFLQTWAPIVRLGEARLA